jgi:hypothetical protein
MPTHVSSSNHSDLKVLFEDLHFEAPREVGLTAQQALAFWPHQFLEKAIDCRCLLACEALDVFQRNLNANFSLLTRLAGARSFAEILELQATHLSNQASALIGQTEELISLSIRTAFDLLRGSNVSPSDL